MTNPVPWTFGAGLVGSFKAGDVVGADVRLPSGAPAHRSTVTGRAAAQLGDLQSIIDDLERVVALCDRLDAPALDDLVASGIWEAAVVAYGRCFNNGKSSQGKGPRRKVPNEALRGRPADLIPVHEGITQQYRGQHVGHRIGPGEQIRIDALRESPDGPVIGLFFLSARLMQAADHGELRRLAEDLLGRVRPIFQREREELITTLNE